MYFLLNLYSYLVFTLISWIWDYLILFSDCFELEMFWHKREQHKCTACKKITNRRKYYLLFCFVKCTWCIWNVQGVSEMYRVYLQCTGCTWNVQRVPEMYRVYLKCIGCIWNVQGVTEMYRVYLKCAECFWNVQGASEILDQISAVRRFDSWSGCKPKWSSLSHFLHEDGWRATILTAWQWNYF